MNELENAIKETFLKYGRDQVEDAIRVALTEGNFDWFTRGNGTRERLKNRYENNISSMVNDMISGFMSKNAELDKVVQFPKPGEKFCMIGGKVYSVEKIVDMFIDEAINEVKKEQEEEIVISDEPEISNVNTYTENLSQLETQMITGLTHEKEGSIELANMQAATSIGKHRENQEDAVLLKIHPNNSKFKLMVVSDGMGGGEKGEAASHIMISEINKWFENLPDYYFYNMQELKRLLDFEIDRISTVITEEHNGESGATIVASIVGQSETIIANSGDSRAYVIKDGKLEQITRDDSQVQDFFEEGIIEKKDDMRFHRFSHKVTQIPGQGTVTPKTYIIKNKDYDKLLLFSDGVTDCLSDEEIKIITKESNRKSLIQKLIKGDNKKGLAQKLVDAALEKESQIRPELKGNPNYYKKIHGGKDNTTAAVYERE